MAATTSNLFLPSRFFLTDEDRRPDPLPSIEGLAPGTGVIFRHYRYLDREDQAIKVAKLCEAKGLPLFIGADPELAKTVSATGVHLPGWALGKPFNGDLLITAAAHNEIELKKAEAAGANALLIGPVFPTKSHPEAGGLGVDGFLDLAKKTKLPVYALGGMSEENYKKIPAISNLAGFAGISGF